MLVQFDATACRPGAEWARTRDLRIGQSNDAINSMRRAKIVPHVELFQPEDTAASPGKTTGRGATHASQTDDDNVEFQRVLLRAEIFSEIGMIPYLS